MISNIINLLIKKNIINSSDRDIYEYGLFVIIFNCLVIMSFLFFSFLLHHFVFFFLFILFWTPYRILVGGAHCSTPFRCLIVSDICFLLAILLYHLEAYSYIITMNFCLMIFQIKYLDINFSFYSLWLIFFLLQLVLPIKFLKILNIAYLLNSLSVTYKIIFKDKFII